MTHKRHYRPQIIRLILQIAKKPVRECSLNGINRTLSTSVPKSRRWTLAAIGDHMAESVNFPDSGDGTVSEARVAGAYDRLSSAVDAELVKDNRDVIAHSFLADL